MTKIEENVRQVRERMARAAERAGRDPQSIALIAVSKTVPAERVAEGIRAGLTAFGENRVQEARDKMTSLSQYPEIHWHLIGHLQTNKAAKAVGLFEVIQSVDSVKLAEKINDYARALGKVQPVLIEVNLGEETTKSGLAAEALPELLEQAGRWPHVRVCGLMAIPPYGEDPEQARPYFARLRELRQSLSRLSVPNVTLAELSMGMSHDYTVAIEEGATMVRVGTAIFGERP